MSEVRSKILTLLEVSERTRIPPNSLRWMRQNGTGPKSGKLGRRVVYRESDVEAWIDQQFEADR
jgi:predicted DNA-binding transcriptional regulator AlpA